MFFKKRRNRKVIEIIIDSTERDSKRKINPTFNFNVDDGFDENLVYKQDLLMDLNLQSKLMNIKKDSISKISFLIFVSVLVAFVFKHLSLLLKFYSNKIPLDLYFYFSPSFLEIFFYATFVFVVLTISIALNKMMKLIFEKFTKSFFVYCGLQSFEIGRKFESISSLIGSFVLTIILYLITSKLNYRLTNGYIMTYVSILCLMMSFFLVYFYLIINKENARNSFEFMIISLSVLIITSVFVTFNISEQSISTLAQVNVNSKVGDLINYNVLHISNGKILMKSNDLSPVFKTLKIEEVEITISDNH